MGWREWPVGGLIVLSGALAQGQPRLPLLPPPIPDAPPVLPGPARSGAEILGRPGIRTRYADPAGPAPSPGGQDLPTPPRQDRPRRVPINESVDFTPSMEEGPFQQPTIRGLLRWDLQPAGPR